MARKTITIEGQDACNLSLQLTGSLENIFDVAGANGLSITEDIDPGKAITAAGTESVDVADYYRANAVRPATRVRESELDQQQEGIGTWIINVDFKVS